MDKSLIPELAGNEGSLSAVADSYMPPEDWEQVPATQRRKLEFLFRRIASAIHSIPACECCEPGKTMAVAALIHQADVARRTITPLPDEQA